MGNYSIRKAVAEDALPILQVQRESWLDTYVNEELGITRESISKRRELSPQRIERMRNRIQSEIHPIWVAKSDGVVVGYCSPNIDEKGRNRVGALYILKEHHRKSIGSQLMDKICEYHKGNGDIFLEVANYNTQAISFYEKHGFKIVEDKDLFYEVDDVVKIPLVLMRKVCEE